MANSWRQREKFIEMLGEGPARRIRLAFLPVLVLVGIALQGLVYWYAAQMAGKEWGAMGTQVWAFAVGVWLLTVGMLLALLGKRLKDVLEGTLG